MQKPFLVEIDLGVVDPPQKKQRIIGVFVRDEGNEAEWQLSFFAFCNSALTPNFWYLELLLLSVHVFCQMRGARADCVVRRPSLASRQLF